MTRTTQATPLLEQPEVKRAIALCEQVMKNGPGGYTAQELMAAIHAHLTGQDHLSAPVAHAGHVPQAEQYHQIGAEGWPLGHDGQPSPGELARAAAAYLLNAYPRVAFDSTLASRLWPWVSGFDPRGGQRDLERGAELALAALGCDDLAAVPAQGA